MELDEDVVREVGGRLRDEGVESIAVCLLHSYINPAHERRIGEIFEEELNRRFWCLCRRMWHRSFGSISGRARR